MDENMDKHGQIAVILNLLEQVADSKSSIERCVMIYTAAQCLRKLDEKIRKEEEADVKLEVVTGDANG